MSNHFLESAGARRIIFTDYADRFTGAVDLTSGERRFLALLDRGLPPGWEIYAKPHLNGLRPDFVILNPNVGIGVYKVDERSFDALSAMMESPWEEFQNPFRSVRRFKNEIFNIYCPRLQQGAGFGAIDAGVVFTSVDGSPARKLQDASLTEQQREDPRRAQYWPVMGDDELAAGRLSVAVPLLNRQGGTPMRPELADDLRGWLVETDFTATQRMPLELDQKQRRLAAERTASGYRRIRGPAGSGKSLVLAARAATLIDEGKDVLIVTFNMTLWHYLRDLINRARKGADSPGRLTFAHFHRWCRDICRSTGLAKAHYELLAPIFRIENSNLPLSEKKKQLRKIIPPIMNEEVPKLALAAADSCADSKKFDAILVDEGQDYQPLWWSALRKALREGGEMILVADTTQDVYGSAKSWTEEAMTGAGFSGGWATLDVSYRLPRELLDLSREFAQQFLPSQTRILPVSAQGEFNYDETHLKWIQCDEQEVVCYSINSILELMKQTGHDRQISNADITYLAGSNEEGRRVVDALQGEPWGIRCAHTFADTKNEQDRRKMAFFLGRPQLKATTLHSFKGWETRMLVLHLGRIADARRSEDLAAAYAAITRLKNSTEGSFLTVICSASQLNDYGKLWPGYIDKRSRY